MANSAKCQWSLLLTLLLLFLAIPGIAEAESVSVNRGTGLGYVFNHRGNCYLILPAHVHGGQRRLTIATSAPVTIGDAEVFRTFWPELDLTIALVRGGLGERCRDTWGDLPRDVQPALDRTNSAVLIRIDTAGHETRDAMTIVGSDLETITAEVVSAGDAEEIYQGTSGGVLRIGDEVVGMAIQGPTTHRATFLRFDEIVARLSRLLEARVNPEISPREPGTDAEVAACKPGTIRLAAIQCSVEPSDPAFACSNLAGRTGPVVFPPGSRPVLMLELDAARPVPVERLDLSTDLAGGAYAGPQSLVVEVSSNGAGVAPRWRIFGAADMSPLGALALSHGTATFADRLRVTVLSSWDDDLPLRLDCVAVR